MRFLQSLERIRQMLIKEFIQTLRDPHTRWILFGPALIQMMVFGYAATMEIKHVSVAVLDLDNTQESRELICPLLRQPLFHHREICRPKGRITVRHRPGRFSDGAGN